MHYKYFNYIPKEKLKAGGIYACMARNFSIGFWNGKSFEYTRTKFGLKYQDTERHYDEGAPYGTVQPIVEILEEPKDCNICGKEAFLLDKDKDIWYCLSCYLKNYMQNKEDAVGIIK